MISSSIFSLPVPVYRQSKVSLKDGPPVRKRKRTRVENNDGPKGIDASTEIDNSQLIYSQQASQFSEYSAVLTPEERLQYRVAGQRLDQKLPTKPFPHSPPSELDDSSKRTHSISNRLASLTPPIYAPSPDTRVLPLHYQHLAAITALLHRALSERDFARAGRALSLILRDTIGGQGLDIRAEGRWGIGAEILLRRRTLADYTIMDPKIDRLNDTESLNRLEPDRPTWFTRKGFEDSRKYYERLIVQYPFHKPNAEAINSLDFYHAMFGLWLYIVQEESKRSKEPLSESTHSEMAHTEKPVNMDTGPNFTLASSQRTLAQAREIAVRMDNCMTTFPFSDDFELIRLRGMVSIWIADLIEDLLDNRSSLSDEDDDNVQADVVISNRLSRSRAQGSEDDPGRALRLEAERAKEKAVEMQRKLQRYLSQLD
jgi:RNA polymerase I specific initiation factor